MTLSILALVIVISRYVPRLAPVWARLPARWHWVPAAVAAAGSVAARAYPGASLPDPWLVALDAAVAVALAIQGGAEPPKPPPVGPSIAMLALLLVGCAASPPAVCSAAGYAAVDAVCQEMSEQIANGPACKGESPDACPEWVAATESCASVIRSQETLCR